MTIRLATPHILGRSPACRAMARIMAERAKNQFANDNYPGELLHKPGRASDHLLRAALRHFGEHGLGAPGAARAQAEKAFFVGDRQAYDWWLGITRMLDRRLAAEAERLPLFPDIPDGGALTR